MSKLTRFGVGLICLMYVSGFALAQNTPDDTNTAVNSATTGVKLTQYAQGTSSAKQPSKADLEALEELRYKHLWIAYSLIWLIVFVFMYRTYKVGTANRASLDALKSRLALLEKQDG